MTSATPAAKSHSESEPRRESLRDTLESIVFAFILAFLFRTFEAEAFVIPTGSMAPTLYGRHKEAICTKCGTKIVVGASDEYDADLGVLKPGSRLLSALCPNCRYETHDLKTALAFNGDRILVNKFPYEIGEPNRWDVFVFKYPEKPDINYIKRLVGLPGETLRIRHGDVYSWDGTHERMLRKSDPGKQRALQMPVYDDSHPPRELLQAGWPERWAPVVPSPTGVGGWAPTSTGWSHDAETRAFQLDAKAPPELNWVRYRHYAPHPQDWELLEAGQQPRARAELIADFCGYNAVTNEGAPPDEARTADQVELGLFWVGDLTVNFSINITELGDQSELVIELCEGVYRYRCRIDPAHQVARLFEINQAFDADSERALAEGHVAISGPGKYSISFANVDDRLCLWVNETLVNFGEGAVLKREAPMDLGLPQDSDLCPVGIAAKELSATLDDLVLQRDDYYRGGGKSPDSKHEVLNLLAQSLDRPEAWRRAYELDPTVDQDEIQVDPDGFIALGDNSPRSADSRVWGDGRQSVPRRNLVGRAFYIYWPHGVPFLNDGRGWSVWDQRQATGDELRGQPVYEKVKDYPKWTIPFYPQVSRMKRIR